MTTKYKNSYGRLGSTRYQVSITVTTECDMNEAGYVLSMFGYPGDLNHAVSSRKVIREGAIWTEFHRQLYMLISQFGGHEEQQEGYQISTQPIQNRLSEIETGDHVGNTLRIVKV